MGKIIQNYSIQELIGEGVYGKVYKAVHLKTKQQVAMKVIHADKFKQIPKLQQCTVNQINILSTMQTCPYIVKYIDMLKTVNNFYFVYEFCNGGTLDKLMKVQGPFPEKKALVYYRQLIQAFKVLSKSNIMHRDLKPDNIFLHNGILKLGDFGFCKPLENNSKMAETMLGSPIYMAPEVLKGESYNIQADIWSLGVVLFQMVYGKCPFESKSIAKLIQLLNQNDLIIPQTPKISLTLEKLLKRMLVKDYKMRIDWNELFEYTITQSGELYLPKNPLNQFQLRGSIKNTNEFGMLITGNSSYSSPIQSMTSITQSQNTTNIVSPKINKGHELNYQQARNMMLKKKSPTKNQNEISISNESKISSPYYKNDLYSKGQRSAGRLDMLIKNHGKLMPINQIALDCLASEKQRIAISYLLFKNIEKQTFIIFQGLKKQTYDSRSEQFRLTIQKQIESIKQIITIFKQCLNQEQNLAIISSIEQPNKSKILKIFYEGLRTDSEEQIILAAQIIDYLDQGLLIKKDSYERMGKETLLKQVRNKFIRYL